jgi:hypothetical protein
VVLVIAPWILEISSLSITQDRWKENTPDGEAGNYTQPHQAPTKWKDNTNNDIHTYSMFLWIKSRKIVKDMNRCKRTHHYDRCNIIF